MQEVLYGKKKKGEREREREREREGEREGERERGGECLIGANTKNIP